MKVEGRWNFMDQSSGCGLLKVETQGLSYRIAEDSACYMAVYRKGITGAWGRIDKMKAIGLEGALKLVWSDAKEHGTKEGACNGIG